MAFGHLVKRENLDPKSGSNASYFTVMVKSDGIETLIITEKELERIRHRATRNPEDTKMVPTWWDKLTAAFAGIV